MALDARRDPASRPGTTTTDAQRLAEAGAVAVASVGSTDSFNHRRPHGEIGLIPPAEHEEDDYRHNTAPTTVAGSERCRWAGVGS